MSWHARRVSEHDSGEGPARLACSSDCRLVPSDSLHVCGQIPAFWFLLPSPVDQDTLIGALIPVARRLQPDCACAARGTDDNLSDVAAPT